MFQVKKIGLICILFIASLLRLWNLGTVPPSTSMDEASISYNAYSIIKTGADEYSEIPILSHRAYDDWRRATYLYLSIPFISILGLTSTAIRLPAVILSVLTVWAVYYIVLRLFKDDSIFSSYSAFFAAFFLAINPWHIYISRLGHESNAYLSFFVFGVLFFLQGLHNKKKILVSFLFFILSMISYYAGQILIPLFIFGLIFIYRKIFLSLLLDKKKIFIVAVFSLVFIFILKGLFSKEALVRYQGTNIFNSQQDRINQYAVKRAQAIKNGDLAGIIMYNRRILMISQLAENYISHINPKWLFINSSNEPFKVPYIGLLNIWEAPFIILGISVSLFSGFLKKNSKKFLFLWFFLAPLPGIVATGAPHAMRSYPILPVWEILAAFGLSFLLLRFQKYKNLLLVILSVLILVGLMNFYKNYFFVFPKEQSNSFHYALSKTVPYVLSKQNDYDKIIFSNKDNLYQSYMLFLYYSHYDPFKYQRLGGTKSGGYAESHMFDKYEFRSVNLKDEKNKKKTLYIVNSSEVPDNQTRLATFKNLDGKDAITIVSE